MKNYNILIQARLVMTHSGMKVWATLLDKESLPVEVLLEDKRDIEWVVENDINTSHDHTTSYRNEDCNCNENFLIL